jgi:hypothetical protein
MNGLSVISDPHPTTRAGKMVETANSKENNLHTQHYARHQNQKNRQHIQIILGIYQIIWTNGSMP